jgi:enamine deaminase RidA (YjgF/YER057c/UK114 family)
VSFSLFPAKRRLTGRDASWGGGDFDAQARQVFENLNRVLRSGGSSLRNVVKVTIFLRDMSNFSKIVELRERYFTPPYPADTIVEVSSLYSPEALIEIEAIAVADEAAEQAEDNQKRTP